MSHLLKSGSEVLNWRFYKAGGRLSFDRAFRGILIVSLVALYGVAIENTLRKTLSEPDNPQSIVSVPLNKSLGGLVHIRPFGLGRESKPIAERAKAVFGPILVTTSADLDDKFSKVGFDLSEIRGGAAVPRLTLVSLPRDLPDLRSVEARKNLFIRVMLPLVLQANEHVRHERTRLLNLKARRGNLGQADLNWLSSVSKKYGVKEPILAKQLSELKRRIDIIPPSLALAQAAEESGWGTSRFALDGNAVFGQWTFTKGKGIVPANRESGKNHEVKAFTRLHKSITSYVHNLNTHWAYKEFRVSRALTRARKDRLRGKDLISSLKKYSQRGEDYVRTIKTIIRVNGFSEFDGARLRKRVGGET